ncbi:UTP--glucose-1-phosphate uridylyltransferase isoform X4 [Ixodes scapularis]
MHVTRLKQYLLFIQVLACVGPRSVDNKPAAENQVLCLIPVEKSSATTPTLKQGFNTGPTRQNDWQENLLQRDLPSGVTSSTPPPPQDRIKSHASTDIFNGQGGSMHVTRLKQYLLFIQIDEFKSIKKFKIFNTNNLWMKLSTMSELVQSNGIDMEVIVNHKTLDTGVNVVQLETAAGAAMKDFSKAIGINVPRSRFLPVKKTSDLLLVMSNLYHMKFGTLVMSPKRTFPTVPLIKLGDNHFAKVREFLQRFASIPDILELDHLTVSGDVTFGKGVSLRGTVIIIANHGDRIDIPASAVLENKIVSGNLRILDH